MKEINNIISAFDAAQRSGIKAALATVVQVEGSSYRKPGARMLITDDGNLTGAISGGCLEGDALRRARLVIAGQKATLVTYDTTDEDDAKTGIGLGCNGIIHILIEPIDPLLPHNPIALLKLSLIKREPVVLLTLFSLTHKHGTQPGTCALFRPEGLMSGSITDEAIRDSVTNDARLVLLNRVSLIRIYRGHQVFTGFVEIVLPAVSLIIVGAGNDAIPLTELARTLGWEVTVIDGRSNYALKSRFPAARQLIISRPETALSRLRPDDRTAVVLMTHNYNYDLAVLKQLLPMTLPYIGALGPGSRAERMLRELKNEGFIFPENGPDNLYGPAGLDTGSENSEEIALSIFAEIQMVINRRNGTSLRNKTMQPAVHGA